MKTKHHSLRIAHLMWAALAVAVLAAPMLAEAQPPGRGYGRGPGGPGFGRGPGGPGMHGMRPPGPPPIIHEMLKDADTDGDEAITLEEFTAALQANAEEIFTHMDRNGDGVLNPEDRPEGGPPHGPGGKLRAIMDEADTDGDKALTYEELSAVAPHITEERFDMMDRNGDGVLNKEDHPTGGEGGPGYGRGGPGGPGGPGGRGMMRGADTDGEAGVSFEELSAINPRITQERFDMMDANGDGVLTHEDRPEGGRGAGKGKGGGWGRGGGPRGGGPRGGGPRGGGWR